MRADNDFLKKIHTVHMYISRRKHLLTKSMIPFKIVLLSIPTFNKSNINLSNFSGVSLLRILREKK